MKRAALTPACVLGGVVTAGICFGTVSALQETSIEPKEGTYGFHENVMTDVTLFVEVRLIKPKSGAKGFNVEGVFVRSDNASTHSYRISGNLTASGKLRAQYYQGTNKNNAIPLDGHWDPKTGTLVFDPTSNFSPNPVVAKATKSISGTYAGDDWGTVELQALPEAMGGTYRVSDSDNGTFQMILKEGGGYSGNWAGQNGHRGTVSATGGAGTFKVEWQCTGTCGGRTGTSTWTLEDKKKDK